MKRKAEIRVMLPHTEGQPGWQQIPRSHERGRGQVLLLPALSRDQPC